MNEGNRMNNSRLVELLAVAEHVVDCGPLGAHICAVQVDSYAMFSGPRVKIQLSAVGDAAAKMPDLAEWATYLGEPITITLHPDYAEAAAITSNDWDPNIPATVQVWTLLTVSDAKALLSLAGVEIDGNTATVAPAVAVDAAQRLTPDHPAADTSSAA